METKSRMEVIRRGDEGGEIERRTGGGDGEVKQTGKRARQRTEVKGGEGGREELTRAKKRSADEGV